MAENEDLMIFPSGMFISAVFEQAIEAAKLKSYDTGNKQASVKFREAGEIFEVFRDTSVQSLQDKFDAIYRRKAVDDKVAAAEKSAELAELLSVAGTVTKRGDDATINWLGKFTKLADNTLITSKPYQQAYQALEDAGYRTTQFGEACDAARGSKTTFGPWLIGAVMNLLQREKMMHPNQWARLVDEYKAMSNTAAVPKPPAARI